MQVRQPAVAGQFYGAEKQECLGEVRECLEVNLPGVELPDRIAAGVVPHAGWVFSGDLAGMVFNAIRRQNKEVDTFIVYGAAHRWRITRPSVYYTGAWQSPLGRIEVDENLAQAICYSDYADKNLDEHAGEHSIEVQVPFIQFLFPDARIVPILTPPNDYSAKLGAEIGGIISKMHDKSVVCVASSDLTHYGPRYGYAPKGTGEAAIQWAKDVNDMGLIEPALRMDATAVLEAAEEHASACGAGAIAAAVETARTLGRSKGVLLAHTHSNEVMKKMFGRTGDESVGYAAMVF